jgi:hypothetical protein
MALYELQAEILGAGHKLGIASARGVMDEERETG